MRERERREREWNADVQQKVEFSVWAKRSERLYIMEIEVNWSSRAVTWCLLWKHFVILLQYCFNIVTTLEQYCFSISF